jgi:uncharacterized protein (TIRG00374 family)
VKSILLATMLLGGLVLAGIVRGGDLREAWHHLARLGAGGMGLLLAAHALRTLADAASWLLTLPSVQPTPRWLCRIWTVLLVASALELLTPLGGLGGEPMKAVVLKRHYGIRYTEAAASLVLTRTTDMLAVLAFVTVGGALVLGTGLLSRGEELAALVGFGIFALAAVSFVTAQRTHGFSRIAAWLGRRRPGRFGDRLRAALAPLTAVEGALVAFYERRRTRLALSAAAAFAELTLGACADWLALWLLGHPATLRDALVIQAVVLLVTNMLFFVPANLGTQEGALVLVCGALFASPALGLALAAIRRARDLAWIAGGLVVGSAFSASLPEAVRDSEGAS